MTQVMITGFSLGTQNRASQEQMKGEALYYMKDLSLEALGSVMCRRLNTYLSDFSGVSTTDPVKDVYQVDVEGTSKRLLFYRLGGSLYCYNSETNATRTVSSAMSGGVVYYAPLKPILSDVTYVFITDGTTMLADNGSSAITWGIGAPTGAVFVQVLASVTGNLSAGAYKYVYTFYDAVTGSESDPSPACAPLTVAANQTIDVSNIGTSSNTRVTARRLYRTIANGGSYYLVATIPDNVTTSFFDTIADSTLSVLGDTDQGEPPVGSMVVSFRNMLMLAGDSNYPNRVYYCMPDRPDNFPSFNYIDAGSSDDKIVGMVEWEGKMYFVQSAGIAGLEGTSADNFVSYKTRSLTGTAAGRTAVATYDGIYFLGFDGVYRFDGGKSVKISEAIEKCFGPTASELYDVVDYSQVVAEAKAVFFQGKYHIVLPMLDYTGTVQNKLWVYDLADKSWLLHDMDLQDVFADEGRGELYGSMLEYGSTTDYTVYKLLHDSSSTVDVPVLKAVTKAYPLSGVIAGSTTEGHAERAHAVGWMKRYRIEATGSWTVKFYLDGRLVHTGTHSNVTLADRYKWYNLPGKLKGVYVYVQLDSTGSPRPDTHSFSLLEIR